MSLWRRVMGALVMVGLFLPGMAGAEPGLSGLCNRAHGAEAGTRIEGYTVVYGTGGSRNQIVLGYGGEYLSGGSGNDVLCAWNGGNMLDGGSGNDVLIVMSGYGNTLSGGSGNDTLIGYEGDILDGGSGSNEIVPMPDTRIRIDIVIGPVVDGLCLTTWTFTNGPADTAMSTTTTFNNGVYYWNFLGAGTTSGNISQGSYITDVTAVTSVTSQPVEINVTYPDYACGAV